MLKQKLTECPQTPQDPSLLIKRTPRIYKPLTPYHLMLRYRPAILNKTLRVRKSNTRTVSIPEVTSDKVQRFLMKTVRGVQLREVRIERFGRSFTDVGAKYLFQVLKHIKIGERNSRVNNIALAFGKCKLTAEGLSIVKAALLQIKGVSCLAIELKENFHLTSQGITKLMHSLARMNLLKSLHLAFDENSLNDRGMQQLAIVLPRIKLLESLSLSIWNEAAETITDKGLSYIFCALPKLSNLKSLKFCLFMSPSIQGTGLDPQSEYRGKLQKLQIISLEFSMCKAINNQGLQAISKLICSAPCLNTLSLNCYQLFGINAQGIKAVLDLLGGVSTLQKLNLNFRMCAGVSHPSFQAICHSLSTLTQLTELVLDLGGCPAMNDAGFNQLGDVFLRFVNLKSLIMNFAMCQHVTNPGVESLVKYFPTLQNLAELRLDFSHCNKITDACLSPIAIGCQNLAIKAFDIKHERCPGFTQKGLAVLELLKKRFNQNKI